ncbi:hypothetical protein BMR02_05310 [Methylococcaceae bacterium HT1]|nr:hypothetical protein BMR10_01775 [Methylococcaceae bacterium CS4]TXL00054.1 hypothetical protein BMR11_04500 [Methylococcaceae bacterium CS5]TXL00632.1 hypothetical protein BMR02_05310 [Methylococcaceae bacterium HT1]TXL06071.1 hypothetical protein BMR07_08130 [Methylococcaceae bacterium CS1]TXL06715.1 hypothetical protein BMR09_07260 [Methylococcaceae bacterium CS3]TXL10481.1 hypothetical protein BMR08_08860 [Methylococcaceae bacterium CS2]TXL15721.1 hypothetical protein BMR05_02565 [Meth
MLKNIFVAFLDNPFIASIVISDLFILLFHKPPFIFSLGMFAILIAYCLFLGQKLAIFKI